jgi:threonine dehydrogenase-like Zn-dependent dehydrogenase
MVEAALRLIEQDGLASFTVQDVLSRADVALQTFYRHFSSKDEFLLAVLERTTPEERADLVRSMTEGRGADVIIEAAGRKAAFDEGIELLAEGGRYLILGLYSGHGKVELDPFRLNNNSQSVIGSLGGTHHSDNLAVIRLAQRFGRRLGFADLITHRFPLANAEQAIATMRSGEAIKAVVLPETDAT